MNCLCKTATPASRLLDTASLSPLPTENPVRCLASDVWRLYPDRRLMSWRRSSGTCGLHTAKRHAPWAERHNCISSATSPSRDALPWRQDFPRVAVASQGGIRNRRLRQRLSVDEYSFSIDLDTSILDYLFQPGYVCSYCCRELFRRAADDV